MSEPTEEKDAAPAAEAVKKRRLKCPACGSTRLKKTPSYGFIGWVLLLFGATPDPDGVDYHCQKGGKEVELDDEEEEPQQ